MSREAALRLALGEAAPVDVPGAESLAASPLAKRGARSRRAGRGGSQQQANRCAPLHLGGDSCQHIRHIMDKLGVNSRSQIAVLMTPRLTIEPLVARSQSGVPPKGLD